MDNTKNTRKTWVFSLLTLENLQILACITMKMNSIVKCLWLLMSLHEIVHTYFFIQSFRKTLPLDNLYTICKEHRKKIYVMFLCFLNDSYVPLTRFII